MPINSFLYPAPSTPNFRYDVANSCRFNDDDSAYMHKTPSSTGVEEKFTFSFWIKFNSAHSANQCVLFIEGDNGADDYVEIAFKPQLDIQFNNGTPPAEERHLLEQRIFQKFGGSSNAGKFILA